MVEFTNPRSGWAAECRDCPSTIEPDYGARVYPREEFPDTPTGLFLAKLWSEDHVHEHPGHRPKIDQFHRWTMTATYVAPALLKAIFGGD